MTGGARSGGRRRSSGSAPGEVHVWRVPIPADAPAIDEALRALPPEERAWAARLRVPEARARFVLARAALRALLGDYLGRAPARIRIVTGPHGKPALGARPGEAPLHFSVSHSGALALLALSAEGPVGVDVERLRELPNALALAERFFTPRERRAVLAARRAERSRVFLSLWCAKEAVLKARGDGLAGLERIEIARRGGAGGRLFGLEDGEARWSIHALAPGRGYVGAVASAALPRSVRARR